MTQTKAGTNLGLSKNGAFAEALLRTGLAIPVYQGYDTALLSPRAPCRVACAFSFY